MKLHAWRDSVFERDHTDAQFDATVILSDVTIEQLSAIGNSPPDVLEALLKPAWIWWDRYGHELVDTLQSMTIKFVPQPRKSTASQARVECVDEDGPGYPRDGGAIRTADKPIRPPTQGAAAHIPSRKRAFAFVEGSSTDGIIDASPRRLRRNHSAAMSVALSAFLDEDSSEFIPSTAVSTPSESVLRHFQETNESMSQSTTEESRLSASLPPQLHVPGSRQLLHDTRSRGFEQSRPQRDATSTSLQGRMTKTSLPLTGRSGSRRQAQPVSIPGTQSDTGTPHTDNNSITTSPATYADFWASFSQSRP